MEVWLKEHDLGRMVKQAQRFAPDETGGVFVGYRVRRSIIITHVIGSGPKAIHAQEYYRPDVLFEQNEIAKIYEASGRMFSYLGDWHTHPSGALRLSRKDKAALAIVANDREARAEHPIMAILAGRGDDWGLHIWEFSRVLPLLGTRTHSTKLTLY